MTNEATKDKAEVRKTKKGYGVFVNDEMVREYDEFSDDYAWTNAKDYAHYLNTGEWL